MPNRLFRNSISNPTKDLDYDIFCYFWEASKVIQKIAIEYFINLLSKNNL